MNIVCIFASLTLLIYACISVFVAFIVFIYIYLSGLTARQLKSRIHPDFRHNNVLMSPQVGSEMEPER